jgi:hypothetical protein
MHLRHILALKGMLYIPVGLAYSLGHLGIVGLVFQDPSMLCITHNDITYRIKKFEVTNNV